MTTPDATAAPPPPATRPMVRSSRALDGAPARTPWVLGWLLVLCCGYQLVGLGAVLPTLVGTGTAGLTPAWATAAATAALVGTVLGALAHRGLARDFDRRRILLVALVAASLAQLLTVAVTGPGLFALVRLVGGVGVGLTLSAVVGMTPGHGVRRRRTIALAATGYHVGGALAAGLALLVLPAWGVLQVVGGVVGLVLVPVVWVRAGEPAAVAGRRVVPFEPTVRQVASWRHRWVGAASLVASFLALAALHGLNTWLPTLLTGTGPSASTPVLMLLVLNLGGVLGLLAGTRWSSRWAGRRGVMLCFAVAAVALAALTLPLDPAAVLVLLLVVGMSICSGEFLVQVYLADVLPPASRGAANGLLIRLGRAGGVFGVLALGTMVATGAGGPWAFQLLAALALVGLLSMVVLTPRTVELRRR